MMAPATSHPKAAPAVAPNHASRAAAALVLAAVGFGLLWPSLVGSRALHGRDVLTFYFPQREALAAQYAEGRLPQWVEHTQSGQPALANLHAGVLYPPHLLFQWLSFPRAYVWFVFTHQLAAALGMWALLRRLGAGGGGALLGALSFELSGYVVGLTSMGPLMAGLAYLPWVLWVFAGKGPLPRRAPLLALLWALQLLSGDAHGVLFSCLCALAWVAWSPQRRDGLLLWLTGGALAALLTGIQLVPAMVLLGESTRASWDARFLTEFSLHPARLLELLAPMPFGTYLGSPPYWGSALVHGPGLWPFVMSGYLGAAASTLAAVGARKSRHTGFALTLVGLGILLALGRAGGLGQLVLPWAPFRFFRFPEKYLQLTTVGTAVLVGLGAQRVLAGELRARRLWISLGGWSVAAVASLCLWLERAEVGAALGRSLRLSISAEQAAGTLVSALGAMLAFSALALAVALLVQRQPRRAGLLGAVLAGVVAVDLFSAAASLVVSGPIELYQTRPQLADELTERLRAKGVARWIRDPLLERSIAQASAPEQFDKIRAWDLSTLRSDLSGAFGLEEVRGHGGSFQLNRWNSVALALYPKPSRLGALFNGCYALASARAQGYRPERGFHLLVDHPDLGVRLFENTACLPRLWGVRRVTPVETLAEATARVARADFDPAQEAVLEHGQAREFDPATVEQLRVERGKTTARVHADGGGAFLVFATSYYPGWSAAVDGLPRPTEPVDGAIQGFEVPPGDHLVELTFRDPGLTPGAALTGLGAAMTLALFLFGMRRPNKPDTTAV